MARRDYSNDSKDDLIKRIRLLEKKKFGLIWEEKPEEIADRCRAETPILTSVEENDIHANTDPLSPTHVIIEGDNYHALHTLNVTHKNKIDLIYIDPPYNTGAKNWKYNNSYVDSTDAYRHSKWLSFMHKRIRLAKSLLTDKGIILVTIDDNEVANLTNLMNQIYGEGNHLSTIVIQIKAEGRTDDKYVGTAHEYMLVYAKNALNATVKKFITPDEEVYRKYPFEDDVSRYSLRSFRRGGANSRRNDRPNLFYPIYYSREKEEVSLECNDSSVEITPVDSKGVERVWRWGVSTFKEKMNTEIVIVESKKNSCGYEVMIKKRTDILIKPTTVWTSPKYNAAAHGTKLLEKILGKNRALEYPKSLYAVMDSIKIASEKDSVILDFFAGSGTTGHAVLEVNKEDGGNRQFIMCNDSGDGGHEDVNVCRDVCYERIKRVIAGYDKVCAIAGNVKYYMADFFPRVITDQDKRELVLRSSEMLCLAENCFQLLKDEYPNYRLYKGQDKITAIIYDEDHIQDAKAVLAQYSADLFLAIYVFSYDADYNEEDFEGINQGFVVKTVPELILNTYKRISRTRRR